MEQAALELSSMTSPEPIVSVASYVRGVGMAVPPKVVPNAHFASYLETTDEWIRDRTGIIERRWAEPSVAMSELAAEASEQALASAGMAAGDIDGIIVATVTPDAIFPSTACMVQKRLGVTRGPAFDLNAACSGFLYALTIADGMIAAGRCKNILVIGADLFSRLIDPNDRATCVLFGDGAGAVVLSSAGKDAQTRGSQGRAGFVSGSGRTLKGIYLSELQAVPAGKLSGAALEKQNGYLYMNGREVFKLAVRGMSEVSERVLHTAGFTSEDVDYFICHQANERILLAMAKQIGIPEGKVLTNVQRFGNTSAASLPIVLAEFSQQGKIKSGDLLLLTAFGGGLTWGATLLRW
jgi:3-oxoacyl-[acyl-carrier-protein] synthase III